jgi:hypothetical protein
MRGFLKPSLRPRVGELQETFGTLSRHRRAKFARVAQTTLVKAHQWSRGGAVDAAVAGALESAVKAFTSKAAKKA